MNSSLYLQHVTELYYPERSLFVYIYKNIHQVEYAKYKDTRLQHNFPLLAVPAFKNI